MFLFFQNLFCLFLRWNLTNKFSETTCKGCGIISFSNDENGLNKTNDTKQIPNNKMPEANDPSKKYFIPASLLKILSRSLAESTYNEMDKTSIPKKNIAKLPKETMVMAPVNRNTFMAMKSENLVGLSE